ncbi:MAG: hypothetical protein GX022_02300 [Clostridiaceae bacterium]|nr:hypothetical protein [Clostridiaceae bacterium]
MMFKLKNTLSLLLIIVFSIGFFTGCSSGKNTTPEPSPIETPVSSDNLSTARPNYSEGIDENGFWSDIKASDYVQLTKYTEILIPSNIHTISDEAVKNEIDSILALYSTKEQITERAVKDGDTVNIDYVGTIDGVEFEGGSTNGLGTEVTIGVTNYIDDFLEQIIGHTPGESFNVEVTFPEDYGVEELNGKDAVFAVTLNYIVESVTPGLSDEFVAEKFSAYGWNTISDMETSIREDLKNNAVSNYIQNYIIDNSIIKSLPENLIKHQEKLLLLYFQSNASSYNMEFNDFLNNFLGFTDTDKLLQFYADSNRRAAEFSLIIQAIAEDANITVSDNDVVEYFKYYYGTDDYSMYKEIYGMPYIKQTVLSQAVMDYLLKNAVLA